MPLGSNYSKSESIIEMIDIRDLQNVIDKNYGNESSNNRKNFLVLDPTGNYL